MAELKVGEPFGIGAPNFQKLDLNLALERIQNDLKTDFIYAPHLGLIYARAGEGLKAALEHDLKNGAYTQSAIYASARFWKGAEKTNARATWGNLSLLNQLLTKAIFPTS